jgi:transcriptional regulator with XRE-family HTH domain
MPEQKPTDHLDEAIRASGIRVHRIAAACDVSEGTLRNWRLGKTAIPSVKLVPLAEVLGVTVAEMMGWDTPADEAAA